jgi:hypothetical protein
MVGIIDVKGFQAYVEKYTPFEAAHQQTLAHQTTRAIVPALAGST